MVWALLVAGHCVTVAQVGFNKACGLVEAGEWGAAEQELRHAIKLGAWGCGPARIVSAVSRMLSC